MTLAIHFLTAPIAVVQGPSGHSYIADSARICDVPLADAQGVVNYIPRSSPDPDASGLHLAMRLMAIAPAQTDR